MRQFASYEEENIHYWTNRASGYSGVNQEELATDQKRVWGYTISRKIAARFPGRAPESLRLLGVGTGPSFFAIVLAGMGYQVTAVDYTASMLAEARRNAGALADKIRFRQMNAEELSFADHSFDVVVTRNVTWNPGAGSRRTAAEFRCQLVPLSVGRRSKAGSQRGSEDSVCFRCPGRDCRNGCGCHGGNCQKNPSFHGVSSRLGFVRSSKSGNPGQRR